MKKTQIIIFTLLASISLQAQIAIGKNQVSSPSVSLEFGNENRGLLLPWVDSEVAVNNPVNGTLVFDGSENKVKVKYASGWKDLSIQSGTTVNPLSMVDGKVIQNLLVEKTDAKVSIGEPVLPAVEGILVLEDSNKAMVLPKVSSPHLNILNPTPGLMVFDPVKRQLAVFNGQVWTYWKAD